MLGTNPAGRSALITRVRLVLEVAVHGGVHVRDLRPRFLSGVRDSNGGLSPEIPAPDSQPRGLLGCLRSLFWLADCALDCVGGYWVIIYSRLVKGPCIWIFDRYFDDLLRPSPGRNKALPQWVVKSSWDCCSQARRFDLHGLPARRHAQGKPGGASRRFQPRGVNVRVDTRVVWVDADGTPEDSAERALSAVVAVASARYRKRRLPCTNPSQAV